MLIKILISAVVALIIWFVLRVVIYRLCYYNRYELVINLYNMLLKIEETAKEHGDDVTIEEIELKFGLYNKTFKSIYDVYRELIKICEILFLYQNEFSEKRKRSPRFINEYGNLVNIYHELRLKLWVNEDSNEEQNDGG